MRRMLIGAMLLTVGCRAAERISAVDAPTFSRAEQTALVPDLRTVVPTHLQLVNSQQREILRFSNGIANTGDGPLQLRPQQDGDVTLGIQQILDADGNVVEEFVASVFELHEDHNHWHLDKVARFEVRAGAVDGPVVGPNSVKVTFCLIDWYELNDGNSGINGTYYFDCERGLQGISVGWVDRYHQSTEGQQLDLTGAPEGVYYLVSTANPDGLYREKEYDNNTAWVSFQLIRESQGNAKLVLLGTSPCDSPGLCGEEASNR